MNKPERPEVCTKFQCSWFRGFGAEEDRPDKTGIMVNVYNLNGGEFIFAIETKKDAVKTTGRNTLIDIMHKIDLPCIVVDYEAELPHLGNRVIIKNSHKHRASNIIDGKIADLSVDLEIYKLRIN